ncbi:hypothetical protein QVD17_39752 [Tagetes erecta]|uniref:Uncharacterized protein n=1 Tax=Tagetes erecta TaxID=13708 RepID=A0AAD8JR39_TARER|nr:hypothetical protein QVD17_39752 [Tagetes erecta]
MYGARTSKSAISVDGTTHSDDRKSPGSQDDGVFSMSSHKVATKDRITTNLSDSFPCSSEMTRKKPSDGTHFKS